MPTGELTFVEAQVNGVNGVLGIAGAMDLAASPDGANLYASGTVLDTIAVFDRDPGSGLLTFAGTVSEGIDGVVGLMLPRSLALSPDDRYLFVAGINSLVVFGRDPATGQLVFLQSDFDGDGAVVGLGAPDGLATSPDTSDTVRTACGVAALFSDRIFADGFESADVSLWSSSAP